MSLMYAKEVKKFDENATMITFTTGGAIPTTIQIVMTNDGINDMVRKIIEAHKEGKE